MASFKDSFSDLERHRRALEENVEKLRKSLDDWRLWELDYEALQEEVAALPTSRTAQDLTDLYEGWNGMVLKKSEVLDIIFGKSGNANSSPQIVQLLSRRLDYVEQNVRTLEKQLEAAENRLAAVTVVSQPDAVDDEGLPITDIIEELDEDDQVLSYRLRAAGDAQPQVLEALKEVGMKDETTDHKSKTVSQPTTDVDVKMNDADDIKSKPAAPKKGVSFTEDTKPGHHVGAAPANTANESRNVRRLENIIQAARDQDEMDLSTAVLPADESEDDAALRREMLEYTMSEVGPIVAELNLEEGEDDDLDEDYDFSDGEEEDNEFEDDDDEDVVDHLGRSRRTVIGDDYRERMRALETKLGVKSYFTTDDEPSDGDEEPQVPEHGIGRISVVDPETATSGEAADIPEVTKAKPTSSKKGVHFAEELDIAPTEVTTVYDPIHGQVKASTEHNADPLSDIVERSSSKPPTTSNSAVPPAKKRVSRFKQDRTDPSTTQAATTPLDAPTRFLDQPLPFRPAPTRPDGQTLSNSVVERDTVPGSAIEPDELDAAMLQREVSEEYHRQRNKMIMREGGFVRDEERAIERVEDDEDEEGSQPRRVSRFKAARLGRE